MIEVPTIKMGCIIEVKYAENGVFDSACREAMKQIEDGGYVDRLKKNGIGIIHKYGIACYKKTCKVAYSRE